MKISELNIIVNKYKGKWCSAFVGFTGDETKFISGEIVSCSIHYTNELCIDFKVNCNVKKGCIQEIKSIEVLQNTNKVFKVRITDGSPNNYFILKIDK